MDRLIQQALLQVLQPLIDPSFSDSSHGFRPGRRAHDAVCQAQRHVEDGYRVAVDVDLEQFFDRVNHDVLMDRVAKRIDDPAVLRLIRHYLNAGIRSQGVVMERYQGTAQGGPLSPLLANVLPDEGERVLRGLRKQFARLRLQVNEDKTAVASTLGRTFLGFAFWVAPGGVVKRAVAGKAKVIFKQRIRWLTRRSRGGSLVQVIEQLRACLLGWKAYFHLSQTPKVFRELDEWLRHRLRALQLKHWKRGKTMYRELLRLGASEPSPRRVAANS